MLLLLIIFFTQDTVAEVDKETDFNTAAENLLPSLLSVVDLKELLGQSKADNNEISADEEVETEEKEQEKGKSKPTLRISISPAVTNKQVSEDLKVPVTTNPLVRSTVIPERVIYFTTQSAGGQIVPTKPTKYFTTQPKGGQNVQTFTTRPEVVQNIPTQPPTQQVTASVPTKLQETNISPPQISPEVKETSKPEDVSNPTKTPNFDLGLADTNLLQLAQDRNLLSTALKDANPENLRILLAFTKQQNQ